MAKFSFAGYRRAVDKRTRRALRLSRWALAAERLARAFWPSFSLVCLVLATALLGGFALLDAGTHRIVMLALMGLVALSLAWGAVRYRVPSRDEAARRLDDADPSHPIATLNDSIAGGEHDAAARKIWIEHLRRAERAAALLRPAPPDLRLAAYDRWALRMFAPALLIGALIGTGENWDQRLETLIAPAPEAEAPAAVAARPPTAEGWAITPTYTGLGTVYLNKLAETGAEIRVPEGSELILRVTDLGAAPVLEAPGLTGFEGFTDFGGALAEARAVLDASGVIEIRDGDVPLARWEITAVPDAPPTIAMPEPPGANLAGALEVFFEARDDYGVDTAWADIVPLGGIVPGRGLEEEPISFALPLPISGRALEVSDSAVRDLGEHPWVGAWVELTLHAEDGAGQRASAGPARLRLPGRYFIHPLAKALVEQRRELAMDFEQGADSLDVLQAVTRRPEAIFDDNAGAYLGTRTAIRRLARAVVADRVSKAAPEVAEFLWLAALSLENGDLSSALERLRAAEEALRRALESGTEEDIRRAMEALRAAIQEYLEEMVRQALERGLEPGQQNPADQRRMMSQQDLQEMLDELQRRAESGLRDQARQMLSKLSRMLEQLQAGRMQQGGQGQQSLEQLQEMIQRQRDLADRTFDEMRRQQREGQIGEQGEQGPEGGQQPGQRGGQPGSEGQQPGGSGPFGRLSAEQEALRRALEELAGQIPGGGQGLQEALDEAGRAMGDARDDLDLRDPGEAVEDQMEALDRLSEGAEALAEQLRNGQGTTANRGRSRQEGEARDLEADPFDRPSAAYGAIDGRGTKVPNRSVLDRARELLEELRRRAGEPTRPHLELEYYDRLMDQF